MIFKNIKKRFFLTFMGQSVSSAVKYVTTSVDYGSLSYNNKMLNLKQMLTSASIIMPCYNTHTV